MTPSSLTTFDTVFASERIEVLRSPLRAPRANAICERVVGTIRRECLDRMLILGAGHLNQVLGEYLVHYNPHRPHWSLDQQPPDGTPIASLPDADREPLRRDILGGLIHQYEWAA